MSKLAAKLHKISELYNSGIKNNSIFAFLLKIFAYVEKNEYLCRVNNIYIYINHEANAKRCNPTFRLSGVPGKVRDFVGCSFASRLQNPIYIETRNFNDYSPWKSVFEANGFAYQPHLNFHIDTTSVELVEGRLGKNRKRDIKTSIRDGATIIENPTIEHVRSYYQLLKQLYTTKIKTPLFSLHFFEQLYAQPGGRFILVELNGEIIGGTVCVELPGKCLYEWFVCGRDGEWKSIFPSSLATYAGIRYAAEHGCSRFDMMGAGKPDEAYGVRDFKARFGGEQVEHGRFLCVRKPLLYAIGKLGVKILKK